MMTALCWTNYVTAHIKPLVQAFFFQSEIPVLLHTHTLEHICIHCYICDVLILVDNIGKPTYLSGPNVEC